MAHSKYVQAVRIYLDTVVSENAALGIWTSGTSEIRISEEALEGTALQWTSGLIAKNGIGDIREGADLSRGGNVAIVDGITVNLIHTNQWILELKDLGIYLPGLKCEIWEFEGTELDSDSVSASVIFTGIIEDMSWNETNIGIPIKTAQYKRNALISEPLFDGSSDIKPVTFGAFYPPDSTVINNLAKFIRATDDQDDTVFTNFYFCNTFADTKIFPVYSVYNDTQFYFKTRGVVSGSFTSALPDNCYVLITSGTGEGQIRKVYSFVCDNPGVDDTIMCTVEQIFLTAPVLDGGSWVQFLQIERDFIGDSWKLTSFVDENNTVVDKPHVYTYSDQYARISEFGFTVSGTDNNTIDVDGTQYEDNIDTLKSYIILPVENAAFESASSVTFDEGTYIGSTIYNKVEDGLFYDTTRGPSAVISASSSSDIANATNREKANYAQITATATNAGAGEVTAFLGVISFDLPSIKHIDNITNIYVGLKAKSVNTGHAQQSITVTMNRYAYGSVDDKNREFSVDTENIDFENLLDQYWDDSPATTNGVKFYKDSKASSGGTTTISGYARLKLENCTKNIYNCFTGGNLYIYCDTDGANITFDARIYDISIILEVGDASIGEEIYTCVNGRKYDSTWGGRKTAASLIDNPIDMIEHCKRLQNWDESGITPGLEYATTALIKTSGTGSFDDYSLYLARVFSPAFQIFDSAKAYTNEIVKRLCQTYNICSRIDSDGYECLHLLEREYPSETIQFSDINGDIGDIEEPKQQDIFCEPVVNYLYNIGSGKYERQLKISDIAAYSAGGSWSASAYGFSSQADAETLLGPCVELYNKFRIIEKCPSDFCDQNTIVTYADALRYLQRKISWMGLKRVNLSVFYSKGKTYFFGKHVILKLPHQTKNYEIECIIERVSRSKNSNTVSLDLVLLDDVALAWQNTVDTGTEYQDTETTGDEYQVISA